MLGCSRCITVSCEMMPPSCSGSQRTLEDVPHAGMMFACEGWVFMIDTLRMSPGGFLMPYDRRRRCGHNFCRAPLRSMPSSERGRRGRAVTRWRLWSAASGYSVAQLTHPVVVLFNSLVFALDHRAHIGRKVFLQSVFVGGFRDILAALALGQNRDFVHAGNRRFDVDPAAVQRTRNRAAVFRVSAQAAHLGLQLVNRLRASTRGMLEHLF